MILSTLILLLPCREIPYLSEYMSSPCDDYPRAAEVIIRQISQSPYSRIGEFYDA